MAAAQEGLLAQARWQNAWGMYTPEPGGGRRASGDGQGKAGDTENNGPGRDEQQARAENRDHCHSFVGLHIGRGGAGGADCGTTPRMIRCASASCAGAATRSARTPSRLSKLKGIESELNECIDEAWGCQQRIENSEFRKSARAPQGKENGGWRTEKGRRGTGMHRPGWNNSSAQRVTSDTC